LKLTHSLTLYTDIRLSKDNEIVVMHDLTLNRTSTGIGAVRDNDWHGYIDKLTTKVEPHQPIPRFNDVLDLLIQPEAASIEGLYMIVDIKVIIYNYTEGHIFLFKINSHMNIIV
jgi:glycerophosphoryl diester phosphodiesterase